MKQKGPSRDSLSRVSKPKGPAESDEQKALMSWAAVSEGRHPELKLLFHVPNEGKRDPRTAARMKAEGLKAGVPDMWLPVARRGYHGLVIEMKRVKGSKVTLSQRQWIEDLTAQGYKADVAYGWLEAAEMIEKYLKE